MKRRISLPRIMIAAPGSGSGKTMITCGILKLLGQNHRVAAFKCGPDYIDPMFHRHILGVPSRNLDTFFTEPDTTRYLMYRGAEAVGADMAVAEGVMGFYDGLGGISVRGSSHELALVTGTPVILTVNGRGMSLSVVALIKGFLDMYPRHMIRGVILNRVSSAVCQRLTPLIEELGITVVGYVPETESIHFPSRHLGLVLPGEIDRLREQIGDFAKILEKSLDMEKLLAIAGEAAPLEADDILPAVANIKKGLEFSKKTDIKEAEKLRIGLAMDEAFCFYYEDNLDLLKELGAELVPFSPLHDRELPRGLHGLYMGGGYPELHGELLSSNKTMLAYIRDKIADGMPCLAECGAFMYLHEVMEDGDGHFWPMVGTVPGRAFRKERLVRFGYARLTALEDSILGPAGTMLPAHEFHYWDTTITGGCFEASKPLTDRSWRCIYHEKNLLAGFPHLYFYGNPAVAGNYLTACMNYKNAV